MDFEDLIADSLGIQDATIESFISCRETLELRIVARQKRECCFCQVCHSPILRVHEWCERELRAPPVGAYLFVTVVIKQLRGYCGICDDQIRSSQIPSRHPEFESLTLSMCELAGRWMEELPCAAVARFFKLNSRTMWELDQYRMRQMKPLMELPEEIDLSKMSADEVHFRTMPKLDSVTKPEIKFVTNLVCTSTSKVLSNASGRDAKALLSCLKVLSKEQRAEIKTFAVDMHQAFIKAVKKFCPNAEICVDRFHLAERVNDAFDDLRKIEFRKAKDAGDDFQESMLSPHRRFVLVEREKKLGKKDLKMLDRLKLINKNILNGMILVEHFHSMLDKTNVEEFRKSLILWYRLVRESNLKPFKKLALSIRKHRGYIEAYVRTKLTTARSEGLNNKIKVLRRSAYGYKNEESYKNKILQRCGYLNSRFIHTQSWFWGLPKPVA